ncbi:MAG: DUF4105 domain-containing protein [Pseudoxanthomonas sp.]
MRPARLLQRLLALALGLLACAGAAAAPRIGVMTMQPGEVFFERFGHDAIVLVDPASGQVLSYNFGAFDPSEPDFLGNFVHGRMMYYLVELPLQEDLASYREEGRGVSIQWLDLDAAQAQALADALAVEARPENARYPYDYFTSNCATRVRDAIDGALGGELKKQLESRSDGSSYRSESVRLASPAWWMWSGFDLGFGPTADRPLSLWEAAFIPMRLARALGEARNSEGRPLVESEQVLLPQRIAPEPQTAPWRIWPWLLAGIAAAVALLPLRRRPRTLGALLLPFWLLCGLGGALMLFIWFGSAHTAGWANRNLLLLDPLCLLLLPAALALLRVRAPVRWQRVLAWTVAAGAALAWVLLWFPFDHQDNRRWVALLLPLHVSIAYVCALQRSLRR